MKRSELGSPKPITPVGILLYKGWRNGSRNTNNYITIRSCGISYKIKIRNIAVHNFNSKQEKLKLKKNSKPPRIWIFKDASTGRKIKSLEQWVSFKKEAVS